MKGAIAAGKEAAHGPVTVRRLTGQSAQADGRTLHSQHERKLCIISCSGERRKAFS